MAPWQLFCEFHKTSFLVTTKGDPNVNPSPGILVALFGPNPFFLTHALKVYGTQAAGFCALEVA